MSWEVGPCTYLAAAPGDDRIHKADDDVKIDSVVRLVDSFVPSSCCQVPARADFPRHVLQLEQSEGLPQAEGSKSSDDAGGSAPDDEAGGSAPEEEADWGDDDDKDSEEWADEVIGGSSSSSAAPGGASSSSATQASASASASAPQQMPDNEARFWAACKPALLKASGVKSARIAAVLADLQMQLASMECGRLDLRCLLSPSPGEPRVALASHALSRYYHVKVALPLQCLALMLMQKVGAKRFGNRECKVQV